MYTLAIAIGFINNSLFLEKIIGNASGYKIDENSLKILFVWILIGDLIFFIFTMLFFLKLNLENRKAFNGIGEVIIAMVMYIVMKFMSACLDFLFSPIAITICKLKDVDYNLCSLNPFFIISSDGVKLSYVSIFIMIFLTLRLLKNTRKIATGLDVS
ncbi:hypothetical protein [Clostridium cavendishii]|nr:hypothetical protein [Clostridium cavendishii]